MPWAFAATIPAARAKPAPISVIRLMMSPASAAKNDAQNTICGLHRRNAAPDLLISYAGCNGSLSRVTTTT
jgi:hypothetical protein